MFSSPASARRASGDETRLRLIAAATDAFLEAGFHAARVQKIAQRAGVRLSAINYHFESKEGLYLAVLQQHAEKALAASPLLPPGDDQPLRARFDFAVAALVSRMLDEGNHSRIGQLLLRELVNPTPALTRLVENFSLPQAQTFLQLLTEAAGPAVPREALARCLISIFGQCMVYVAGRPVITRVAPEVLAAEDVLPRITQHVAEFSWAGLQAVRRQWEGTDAPA
ncbi:MAG: hypothetical protein CGU28_08905 [Candidatus Dactylopiibacterium carminicum]|uniref:DUF1956 domain-containing protein n=1 Tax=Candidatus Dactylopiibacterium carminicum TaxID=857335 RepID=A0A272EWC7_9RHOO|nr:CerR family C-terminal domain-containing protein [Candidatus Dactylopiibacterium carminicum]KAF7599576.1 DUF1956 domain-containing protein [Candidatus Dactylopiibacterium carminicum]PAS94418.1 MAG: hypothetical protein CGU29_03655 [Candidatus Dactylopiibacterium carminicum]PAS96419.1 MAG: hypothetical protein CGU28_08905 [Candidatus Dactylopiibacterium carminicum]PAS99578.1 MAG: hypothetical protein BSR46_07385 [Candidatus Dactylopiibacterium carminicum]